MSLNEMLVLHTSTWSLPSCNLCKQFYHFNMKEWALCLRQNHQLYQHMNSADYSSQITKYVTLTVRFRIQYVHEIIIAPLKCTIHSLRNPCNAHLKQNNFVNMHQQLLELLFIYSSIKCVVWCVCSLCSVRLSTVLF